MQASAEKSIAQQGLAGNCVVNTLEAVVRRSIFRAA